MKFSFTADAFFVLCISLAYNDIHSGYNQI